MRKYFITKSVFVEVCEELGALSAKKWFVIRKAQCYLFVRPCRCTRIVFRVIILPLYGVTVTSQLTKVYLLYSVYFEVGTIINGLAQCFELGLFICGRYQVIILYDYV